MKGAYCLLIRVERSATVRVGALGGISFVAGWYVYIGSAMNNLEKRIARHRNAHKKSHWHIDYLLKASGAGIEKVYIRESETKEECEIASAIAKCGEAVAGFGCSDCKCKSHLIRVKGPDEFHSLVSRMDMKAS